MRSVTAFSPGKVILFGEHAVVHGKLGIAAATSLGSTCTVTEKDEFSIKNITDTSPSREDLRALFRQLNTLDMNGRVKKINDMFELDGNVYTHYLIGLLSESMGIGPCKVEVRSELRKGMGRSASVFSAQLLALSSFFGNELDMKELNRLTYEMEKMAHGGTPSGIDNTTVINGGFVTFRKGSFEHMGVRFALPIVIGDSLEKAKTSVMVPMVNDLAAKHEWARNALDRIDKISGEGVKAIKAGDIGKIGKLMDENQKELEKLKLNTPKLGKLISAARKAGAPGAKISGAGGGGIMIALAEDADCQKRIAKAINAAGGEAITTTLGAEGPKISG